MQSDSALSRQSNLVAVHVPLRAQSATHCSSSPSRYTNTRQLEHNVINLISIMEFALDYLRNIFIRT